MIYWKFEKDCNNLLSDENTVIEFCSLQVQELHHTANFCDYLL